MSNFLKLKDDRPIRFDRMEMMGIVNVTPDSFYEGSRMASHEKAIELAEKHIAEGAVMIDVGGESTRPGSDPVDTDEEIRRICPVIEEIRGRHPDIVISADTYREKTAAAALDAGADMINDISGLTFEPGIARVIADAGAAVVIMHTPARPKTMQQAPHYDDVVEEVYGFLQRQVDFAVGSGIEKDRIMVDIGIGFGKNDEHNLALLREIDRFNSMGCPQLLAVSRKSLIGRTLAGIGGPGAGAGNAEKKSTGGPGADAGTAEKKRTGGPGAGAGNAEKKSTGGPGADAGDTPEPLHAEDRLAGTLAITAYAALHGVAAARVHDVRENLHAARMAEAIGRETPAAGCKSTDMPAEESKPEKSIIAIGSNMGDRRGYIDRALEMIEERAGEITATSDIIETKAYGYEDQDDFLNMAIEIETDLGPRDLLSCLNGIEAELDRTREIHWGPRTIDLDIIFYGDEIVDDEDLHIPHIDMYNRTFVLGPVAQIAPNRVDPRTKKTVTDLLEELKSRGQE